MNYVVQFISHEYGHRSEAFTTTLEHLAETLRNKEKVNLEDFILVVAQFDEDNENQIDWVQSPLFKIQSFLNSQFPEDFMEDKNETQTEGQQS